MAAGEIYPAAFAHLLSEFIHLALKLVAMGHYVKPVRLRNDQYAFEGNCTDKVRVGGCLPIAWEHEPSHL